MQMPLTLDLSLPPGHVDTNPGLDINLLVFLQLDNIYSNHTTPIMSSYLLIYNSTEMYAYSILHIF